ncbi:MAG: 50S ribosomal protein L15 [Clostridia bacterium]|nr:50S ribosomal protein L15 [Clostridia bacterium]
MKLHELSPKEGSVKERFRKGRGAGSGNGKTAGKGHKGQNARSGGGVRPGFEGGQLPLYRKLPKRGFNNFRFGKVYAIVNVQTLNKFNDGDTVDAAALLAAGIINTIGDGIKVLGEGEITKKLTVKAAVFSASAKEKIEAVGGKTEVV